MKHSIIFFFILLILNCSSDLNSGFKIQIKSSSDKILLDDEIFINVISPNNKIIDSIEYYLNGGLVSNEVKLADYKVGENNVSVKIFSNNETISINKKFDIYSNIEPEIMTYNVISEYTHDKNAYTQGLEFYKNQLYESTGLNGKSTLRKSDYKSGEILNIVNLDYEYFGEGLTVINDKIYQLTWKNNIGIIYDLDFNKIGTFDYGKSKEGWGLCNDGSFIYKSDGTNKIWVLDPETLQEIRFIEVLTNKSRIKNINELEYIDGKIYANTYQFNRDVVIVINPLNGVVERVIDFSGIRDRVSQKADLDVMNGIAYFEGKMFVTGKNWDKLFEVEIVSK
tara:strand:- start:1320 stop:2333 length:1014 start_codon:yes stop_codon:yes gene_type:complete